MSPRADSYLSMCLQQASMSPLHYRHGCVIVRGGKVIGHGFNDYRSGFDGGALKTGRLGTGSFDGPAIAELKQKQKHKLKPKHDQKSTAPVSTGTFTPFESNGGGHHANVPLSMHAEMMAIHSAVASCSTSASSTLLSQKPCFKLPGDSKRKARLRREGLEAYVTEVCSAAIEQQAAQRGGKVAVNKVEDNNEDKEDAAVASLEENSMEKHRMKNQYRGHHENMYQYALSGEEQQQKLQKQQHRKQHVHKTIRAPGGRSTETTSYQDIAAAVSGYAFQGTSTSEEKVDCVRSNQPPLKTLTSKDHLPQPTTMLLPTGRTGQTSRSVSERMKHPRLNGADLYVARLGWRKKEAQLKQRDMPPEIDVATVQTSTSCSSPSSLDFPDDEGNPSLESEVYEPTIRTSSRPSSQAATTLAGERSLHDELTCLASPPQPTPPKSACLPCFDISAVHASRPCYRCVSYMHSVGIKRVFWTNEKGQWEGRKVRDLVDALENHTIGDGGDGKGGKAGAEGKGDDKGQERLPMGLFVTKHEVLMMRRLMGRKGDG